MWKGEVGFMLFVPTWTGDRTNPKAYGLFSFLSVIPFFASHNFLSPPLVFVCSYMRKTPQHIETLEKSKTGPFLTFIFWPRCPPNTCIFSTYSSPTTLLSLIQSNQSSVFSLLLFTDKIILFPRKITIQWIQNNISIISFRKCFYRSCPITSHVIIIL